MTVSVPLVFVLAAATHTVTATLTPVGDCTVQFTMTVDGRHPSQDRDVQRFTTRAERDAWIASTVRLWTGNGFEQVA